MHVGKVSGGYGAVESVTVIVGVYSRIYRKRRAALGLNDGGHLPAANQLVHEAVRLVKEASVATDRQLINHVGGQAVSCVERRISIIGTRVGRRDVLAHEDGRSLVHGQRVVARGTAHGVGHGKRIGGAADSWAPG